MILGWPLADIFSCPEGEVYEEIEKLLDKVIARKKLREYGMTKQDIEPFADNVIAMQQRLLNQSYVKFDKATMMKIYGELL